MKKETQRLYHWDNIKFVLILLVVTGHFLGVYENDYVNAKKLFYFIYVFHMPAFIFVSGLFSKSAINGKKFRWDTVFYYALLYFLLKVLSQIVYGVCGTKTDFTLLSDQGVQWYMWAMVLYLCAARAFRHIRPAFMLGISFFVALFVGYDWSIGVTLGLGRFFSWFPFFLMGYYLDPEKVTEKIKKPWITAAGVVVLAGLAWMCYFHLDFMRRFRILMVGSYSYEKLLYPQWGCIFRLVYYVMAIAGCVAFFAIIPTGKTVFSAWGKRTLGVYFWHRPILTIMVRLGLKDFLMKLSPGHWLWLYLGTVVVLTLVLVCPWFEKPLHWLRKQCAGQRMIE